MIVAKIDDSERLRPEELNQQNIEALVAENNLVLAFAVFFSSCLFYMSLNSYFSAVRRVLHNLCNDFKILFLQKVIFIANTVFSM